MTQALAFLVLAPFVGVWFGGRLWPWLRARGWSYRRVLVACYGGCIVACVVLRLGIWALFW